MLNNNTDYYHPRFFLITFYSYIFISFISLFILLGLTSAKMDKIVTKSEQIEKKLIELNLRLVHSIALQHQGMGMELDDLVYEGTYYS